MNVGEKLKLLRQYRGMTQTELAGDRLSRNMLSQIEHGTALPSYKTVCYLSDKLGVDPSYFFDGGETLDEVKVRDVLPKMEAYLREKNYSACVRAAQPFDGVTDDRYCSILLECCFELALERFYHGDLESALDYLNLSSGFRSSSAWRLFEQRIGFYSGLIEHYRSGSPLSARSFPSYFSDGSDFSDYRTYVYLIFLIDNNMADKATVLYDALHISNSCYRSHFNARIAAYKLNYDRAKSLLFEIVNGNLEGLPYPFVFSVYSDLERYCKATEDYENAYRCAVEKRKFEYKK